MTTEAPPNNLSSTAKNGTHLAMLKELREIVATTIGDGCPPRDLASLSRRLQDLGEKIDSIEERNRKDAKESNPCKTCRGTGVAPDAKRNSGSTGTWQPE